MRRVGRVLMGLLFTLAAFPAGATSSGDLDGLGDGYQQGEFGRVRFVEGGAAVLRGSPQVDAAVEGASLVNAPVFPGDTILTQAHQRAEIQLAAGSLVRLDGSSQVEFQSLPSPSATPTDNAILNLVRGSLQLSARLDAGWDFRVDTPAASVFLLGSGEFRIDVAPGGRTRVQSRRGVAELSCSEGSVLVRGGMRAFVEPGEVPEDPRPFSTFALDEFDAWVAARAPRPSAGEVPSQDLVAGSRSVPEEIRPYYAELAVHGTWSYLPTYGYVWFPRVSGNDWRPYFDGYWYYGPAGYFWVSAEPWGWAPYHYGRWTWTRGGGWCWIPGSVFAGAWVSWSWGTAYFGWSPLDYWNQPAWFGPAYSAGIYSTYSWTFVHYENIAASNCGRYAIPVTRVEPELRDNVVVSRPPRVAPRSLARDATEREAAFRAVARNRRATEAPVTTPSRAGQRSFTELERATRRRAGPDAGPVSVRPDPQRSSPTNLRREPPRGVDASRGTQGPTTRSVERHAPQAPPVQRQTNTASPRDGAGGARDAQERVRDLYRRMASPRVTRERSEEAPDSAARARPSSPSARTRVTPRPAPPAASPPRAAQKQPPSPPKAAPRAPAAQPPRERSGQKSDAGKGGRKP